MVQKKPENMPFEQTLSELEGIVTQLEEGELALEDALKQFERGISLAQAGQNKLAQAEQKVQILMSQNGTEQLQTFGDASVDE